MCNSAVTCKGISSSQRRSRIAPAGRPQIHPLGRPARARGQTTRRVDRHATCCRCSAPPGTERSVVRRDEDPRLSDRSARSSPALSLVTPCPVLPRLLPRKAPRTSYPSGTSCPSPEGRSRSCTRRSASPTRTGSSRPVSVQDGTGWPVRRIGAPPLAARAPDRYIHRYY